MTTGALVIALGVLGHPARTPADMVRARLLAVQIIRVAEPRGLDEILIASIIAHESGFNPHAIGKDGKDLGLLQIRRGGAVTGLNEALTDAALTNPPINLAIGAAYLAHVRAACARKGITDPAAWVSQYKGLPARPSKYSRAIIKAADRAREAAREADGPGTMIARVGRGHAVGVCTAPARAQKVAAR